MSWRVKVAKRVGKRMKRFPQKDLKRLFLVLEGFEENPFQGDIEKIKGEDNVWRRRVGAYRVFYEVKPTQRLVEVLDVDRRTTTTYRKKR